MPAKNKKRKKEGEIRNTSSTIFCTYTVLWLLVATVVLIALAAGGNEKKKKKRQRTTICVLVFVDFIPASLFILDSYVLSIRTHVCCSSRSRSSSRSASRVVLALL